MEIRALFRSSFVRWTDVEEFFPVSFGHQTMVGWNYSDSYSKPSIGRKLSLTLGGAEGGLADTYGLSAEALIAILEDWRENALTEG